MSLDSLATPLDVIAIVYFFVAIGLYRFIASRAGLERRSLVGAAQQQRLRWMLNMASRGDNRVLDAILLNSLGQGNAFFASTSAIAVGGLTATLGSGAERLQYLLDALPLAMQSTPVVWAAKQLLIMGIFVYAFFKFAWAFRLSHYATIMIGATPAADAGNPECKDHAERTAKLIGIAGEHANSGIRSFYHAMAALAWFFHPLLFMIATTWVILILARRDFFSRSLRLIRLP
jgi:uncharacterized membrane protein